MAFKSVQGANQTRQEVRHEISKGRRLSIMARAAHHAIIAANRLNRVGVAPGESGEVSG